MKMAIAKIFLPNCFACYEQSEWPKHIYHIIIYLCHEVPHMWPVMGFRQISNAATSVRDLILIIFTRTDKIWINIPSNLFRPDMEYFITHASIWMLISFNFMVNHTIIIKFFCLQPHPSSKMATIRPCKINYLVLRPCFVKIDEGGQHFFLSFYCC